jgi:KUP system potassium uptake protein
MDSSTKHPSGKDLLVVSLAALGVVYGDIGTSPLYALRECFHGPHAIAPDPANVIGILSLIFWALIVVISIKYCALILRADNNGEGGILALSSLISPARLNPQGTRMALILIGLFGAALLYGDGVITPAISVLSAVEGLQVATPFFTPYLVPLTILIIAVLFFFQSHGTDRVGKVFGPVTLIWFLVLAVLGLMNIGRATEVLAAVNPYHAWDFFARNQLAGFLALGTVFLVVTGGEAMYADMGHFGLKPIRVAWFAVVLPALLLNYFGQGALLLRDPSAAVNPFYRMAPIEVVYPLVVLATAATVIASQAVISGAFSLTRQAIQLGFCPRMKIEHTSSTHIGQIYLPGINWLMMLACIGLVLGFRSSTNLAAAYGIAVTATMVITTLLFYMLARRRWKWSLPVSIAISGFFLAIDLAFFGAAATKIAHGGWFPLVVAVFGFTLMTTWKKGRSILRQRLRERVMPFQQFLDTLKRKPPARVPGNAVYMYGNAAGTPPALYHNYKHNKVLHERNVILLVETEDIPQVAWRGRIEIEEINDDFSRVTLHYGFMEVPNIAEALKDKRFDDLKLHLNTTTFFLGRETLLATERPGMAVWRERLFVRMSRNALSATQYYGLPPDRVIEMGTQVVL